jgi:hypothetical protein
MRARGQKSPVKPVANPGVRQPGSMKELIRIRPGFDEADKEIEALFYAEPIEPPARRPHSSVLDRRK